jgi:NTP pyrophosphatase (non-canonical NTP hydrolase)
MGCGRSTDWEDDEELAIFHWNEFTSMSEEEYKAFMDEGITPNEYQAHCLRTNSDYAEYIDVEMAQLQNGIMGLNGEAGECIDILKKVLFQGHELDEQHLAEELGDVLWYVAISADALGYSLERIMIMNRDKLMKRYPDGFEVSRSVNRNETALS